MNSPLITLTPVELMNEIAGQMYRPPLSQARERPHEIAEPLRVLLLVFDFETEVTIEGMLGYLENSAGQHFSETIAAFDTIGAGETGSILRRIKATLHKHGVTPSRLRADLANVEEHQITTFRETHGDLGLLFEEVAQDAERLYLNAETGEEVWPLVEAYTEKNRAEILAEIARLSAGQPPDLV